MERFAAAAEDARFGQGYEPVGEHLRVNAQVVLLGEAGEDGVGNGTDAELQRVAILDDVGDDFADGIFGWAAASVLGVAEGMVGGGVDVYFTHVNGALPVCPGHLLVNLGNDYVGRLDGGQGAVDRGAERTISVRVGR